MNKKLQRDTQHKVVGGVCSGLGNYFDIDTSLIRVLFAFMFLFASAGFWLYLILWIVMPAAPVEPGSAETSQFVSSDTSDTTETPEDLKKNKGSMYAGAILIGIGLFGLVHWYVPLLNWRTVWPVLLIIIGILLIVPIKDKKS